MNYRHLRLLSALALILAAPPGLRAQSDLGNITGRVTDPSRAVIPGAEIVVTNVATNVKKSTISAEAGDYNIPVAPGKYQVSVSLTGFKRFVVDNLVVAASTTVRLDVKLELGQMSDVVEVSPEATKIQTENAKISTSVQSQLVDELPLVVGGAMRSPFDLVSIVPEAKGRGGSISLGGGQAAAWDATLDGVSVTTNRSANAEEIAYNAPSVEAITEFTVDTNGFKAEYGQAGGGVITFASKSGTNQLHGSAYEFLRNDALDARPFFASKRNIYKQHDFGASLGGPVYLPKLYRGKDRTFFFMAFETFRNRVGASDQILSVPTPEMYSGDLSKWVDAAGNLRVIYDPATTRRGSTGAFIRDPFPGNIIPSSRFSAFSQAVMKYGQGVKPNRQASSAGIDYVRNNFITTSGTILNPQTKGSLKIDHLVTDRHRVGFFMNITNFVQEVGAGGPPGLPEPLWDGQVQDFRTSAYRMTYDWTVSPRAVNYFTIGGNKFFKDSLSPNVGKDFGLCMKGSVDCKVNFPAVEFGGEFRGWGGVADNGTEQPLWSFKDDFSLNRGRHNFKMGIAFQSQRANGFGQQDIAGRATFSPLSTSVPGDTSGRTGSAFAAFLLGETFRMRTETIREVPQLYRYYGFYLQDDLRLTSRLTVNVGVRYEFTLPPVSLRDEYSDFTPDRPNPKVSNYPGALRFAGFGPGRENTRSLVPGWYGAFGPRLGIAYAPDSKTALRAAFGRSFSKVTVVSGSGHFAGFIGQYVFDSADQGITPVAKWDNGFPTYPLPPQIDPSFSNNNTVDHWQLSDAARAPESYYWTLSVQRQLSTNTVVEVAYNASIGAHLQTGLVNINQVPTAIWNDYVRRLGAASARTLFNASATSQLAIDNGIKLPYPEFSNSAIQTRQTVNQALRPFPQYSSINTGAQGGDKSGHSAYHSMVIRAERRFSAGFTFQWSYALSKLLTDSDTYNAGNNTSQDQYNRRAEKSIGQFDQTHVVKLNTLYELPFGRGRRWAGNGFLSHLAGGWRVGLIQAYQSGFPIAVTRNNPLSIQNGTTRPTINGYENWRGTISGSKFDPAVDRFVARAAFPTQPDALGNATRYNPKLRGFPSFAENVSIGKSFHVGESMRVDFRWEMFNMFNRVQFGNGDLNLNSATFGVVSSQANDPRQMQVGLKIYW